MKILLAHVFYSPGVDEWYREVASTARDSVEVDLFCVTISPPGPTLVWEELDKRWQRKEKKLMELYARLHKAACCYDALLLYNGANIHPDFLQYLPTFNIYCCFDDPESSANLSAPVASGFDAVFYGNISSRFQYESWGCTRLAWLPIFTSPKDIPSFSEGKKLIESERDIPITFIGEKNRYRNCRLDALVKAFPDSECYGKGWIKGIVEDVRKMDIYRRSKVGWNVHNSTGPINRRLFVLPAFGIMQICDNKTGLGKIFKLGEEVVGFDTIPEAVELTHYYLEHEEERRVIAQNGFRRFWEDYHPEVIWQRIGEQIGEWLKEEDGLQREKLYLPRNYLFQKLEHYGESSLTAARSIFDNMAEISRKILNRNDGVAPYAVPPLIDERVYLESKGFNYLENPEMKGVGIAKEQFAKSEPFEWPNTLALDWAVTSLVRGAKRILEIGSGTGSFAELASVVSEREILCIEEDDSARSWAEQNCNASNITYLKYYKKKPEEEFDLLISLDIYEHVGDMQEFISFCSQMAPRAIFSTPNREVVRGPQDMGPPAYALHVRKSTPGEIYWVLRQYYREVFLFYMPNVYVPWLAPMDILTKGTPIIAECRDPFHKGLER